MVILDNHLTIPGWCCSRTDGNGFFGDTYFDPDLWIEGLTKMATLFKNNPNVVGMSLRNELRGPKENANDWYRYMQKGAEAVHRANPNVLVILSGLNFDKDLSFLQTKPVTLSFQSKIVFEVHWYAFSDGSAWKDGNPDQVCSRVVANYMRMSGFLLDQGYPLFVSEWGVNLRGTNINDNRYLNCFLTWVAEHDLDWALWTLVGSYYLREGVVGMVEYYGVLDSDWRSVRNSSFLDRISAIQSPLQGAEKSHRKTPQKMIYHPSTGLCIIRKSLTEVMLGKCSEFNIWSYTSQKSLNMNGPFFCMKAHGSDHLVTLSIFCQGTGTSWEPMSDSKLHLSTRVEGNATLCLDVDERNNVVTSGCKCLKGDKLCDPESQWFKIVDAGWSTGKVFIDGVDMAAQLAMV
ncbi:hypothetical protein RND81_02G244300 [Saponaria officinalis]|uniref:Glycoside hydrolase family 5 domain-containing protein n=1 Tax=Saponaria officinalis TaxID=3572 RepID=A0AAW1MNT9_SAPOF